MVRFAKYSRSPRIKCALTILVLSTSVSCKLNQNNNDSTVSSGDQKKTEPTPILQCSATDIKDGQALKTRPFALDQFLPTIEGKEEARVESMGESSRVTVQSYSQSPEGPKEVYLQSTFSCDRHHSCSGQRTNVLAPGSPSVPISPSPGGATVDGFIKNRSLFRYMSTDGRGFEYWVIYDMKYGELLKGTKITCGT